MDVNILVADDEKDILDLISEFFKRTGYAIDLAEDVNNAIECMQKQTYDIIITDKNMPGPEDDIEGGMTLLRYAKEHAPQTEVIMMTGYATVETAIEAMKLGAFDYIMKPIPLAELKEKIDRILDYRRFINSENTLKVYRTLHKEVLRLIENRKNLPENQLKGLLKKVGSRIDNLFGMQRRYEDIIQTQAEALESIENDINLLTQAIPTESPYYELIEKIQLETKKRI
jgi:DNA-binding NtrC family response regulator